MLQYCPLSSAKSIAGKLKQKQYLDFQTYFSHGNILELKFVLG